MSLRDVVFNYPTIDNHAHPLLKEEFRQSFPFEGVTSEAQSDTSKDGFIPCQDIVQPDNLRNYTDLILLRIGRR